MRKLAVVNDAVIVIRDGRFAYVGPERDNTVPIDDDFDLMAPDRTRRLR